MRRKLLLVSLLLVTGCAAPRYTYFFPQPAEMAGAKHEVVVVQPRPAPTPSVLAYHDHMEAQQEPKAHPVVTRKSLKDRPESIDKPRASDPYPVVRVKEDRDLRRAAIFGAGGLVALVIGGNLFWVVGSLSLLIGLIFAIKWLLRK